MTKPVALLMSDIHLCHVPPVARSPEPEWYAAMARPLREVRLLVKNLDVPVLCAGDVFDRWNSPPELVNFALDNLPDDMIVVPGQHDLPNHSIEEIKRSAFWTLVACGKARFVDRGGPVRLGGLEIHGFPYGSTPEPKSGKDRSISVALCHRYVHCEGATAYPGAPAEANVRGLGDSLSGYHVAVFGDNHIPFSAKVRDCLVWNCGCLIRRKSDERKITPAVGIMMGDGTVDRHELAVDEDFWLDDVAEDTTVIDGLDNAMDGFLDSLESDAEDSLDFRDGVRKAAAAMGDRRVEKILTEVLDGR